jgi:AcrR family transcriptional regulator
MPRHPDPDLENRILDAAWKLWQGGDKHLSLRTLARAARTNTPAIYRRFKNRKEIMRALMLRLRRDLYDALAPSPTLEDAVDPYLDFALRHPRQYELFFANHYELLRAWIPGRSAKAEDKMPAFFWGLKKLSEQLGGPPERHIPLVITLWALMHGMASLLISRAIESALEAELREQCRRAARALIRDAAQKPGRRQQDPRGGL